MDYGRAAHFERYASATCFLTFYIHTSSAQGTCYRGQAHASQDEGGGQSDDYEQRWWVHDGIVYITGVTFIAVLFITVTGFPGLAGVFINTGTIFSCDFGEHFGERHAQIGDCSNPRDEVSAQVQT